MLPLIALIGIARCASASFCPSNEDLVAAIEARDNAAVFSISAQLQADDLGSIHLVHSERVLRVSEVLCGDRLDEDTAAITCKFTVRYPSRIVYMIARLVPQSNEWVIDDAMAVDRGRK